MTCRENPEASWPVNRRSVNRRPITFSRALPAVILWLLAAIPAWPQGQPAAGGSEAMVRRLAEVNRAADPRRNSFLNTRRVRMIRSVPEPSKPADQVMYLFMLGQEELLASHSAEAVQAFEKILKLVAEHPGLPFTEEALYKVRVSRALAYLRLGEQDNCIGLHNIDRCLLPIRGAGVHTRKRGSRAAIAAYTALLKENPGDLGFRWLLNLAYMTLGEFPDKVPEQWRIPADAFESGYDVGRFYDIAPRLGLDVFGLSGGSIMDDFTGDGYLDIVASGFGLDEQMRFFINNRDGTFTERTVEAKLTGIVGGLNMFQADYDNDGRLDILGLRGAWLMNDGQHPNSLLRNEGPGADGNVTFADVTEEAGLLSFHPTKVGAWGDYDNDGWIDLYVGNESSAGATPPAGLSPNNGRGEDGKVTFTEVARDSGVAVIAYVKGAAWGDVDNDGLIDLYVSNLSSAGPNFLFHNRGAAEGGGWRFADITGAAGVNGPPNSFPTWMFDYDNDGRLDILVFGYRATIEAVAAEYLGLAVDADYPRLYHNQGAGADGTVTFSDVTRAAGLEKVLLPMGANFGDLDNDGYLDFYLGTGDTEYRSLMPNRMFRNDGGKRFQDVTTAGGFGHLQKGHGVAFGDLDHDGDQDVYIIMGGAHDGDGFFNALFENPGHGNNWVSLELEGVTANRAAIGARIKVVVREAIAKAGGKAAKRSGKKEQRAIYVTVGSGGSFGASSLRQEIGLGAAEAIVSVEITWPGDGKPQLVEGVEPRRFYRIRQSQPPRLQELERYELARGPAPEHHHPGH